MSLAFLDAGLNIADEATARLNNAFKNDTSVQTDLMFERMWDNLQKQQAKASASTSGTASTGNSSIIQYNKKDFERVGFSSKAKAQKFADEMLKMGVPVAVSSVKINGQVLVELPKQATVPVMNEPEPDPNDPTKTLPPTYTMQTQSAQQLIDRYKEQTFEEVQSPNATMAMAEHSAVEEETTALKQFVVNNLDDLGVAIVRTGQFIDFFSDKPYGGTAKTEAKKGIFERELKEIETKDASGNTVTVKVAGAQHIKSSKTGKAKTAVVVGDTVIIDGKVVGGAKRDYVLRQHNQRMHKADHLAKSGGTINTAKDKTLDAVTSSKLYHGAHKVGEVGHNVSDAVQTGASKVFVTPHSTLTSIGNTVGSKISNSTVKAVGKAVAMPVMGTAYVSEQFMTRVLGAKPHQKTAYQPLIEKKHQEIKDRRELLQKNAERVKGGMNQQEYVSSETVSRALRKGGVLDEYVNALNTQALTHRLMTATDVSKVADVMNQFKDGTATSLMTISQLRALSTSDKLSPSVKAEIDIILREADKKDADLDKVMKKRSEKLEAAVSAGMAAASVGVAANVLKQFNKGALSGDDAIAEFKKLVASGSLSTSLEAKLQEAIDKVDKHGMSADATLKSMNKDLQKAIGAEFEAANRGATITLTGKNGTSREVSTEKVIKSLDKGFGKTLGIDFAKGGITRENLLKVNIEVVRRAEAMNIGLITATGKFDTKLLAKMDSKTLAKLGLDKNTRDLLINLNEKGAWGNVDLKELAGIASFAMKAVNKLSQDEDTAKLLNATKKTVTYTKKTVTTVKQGVKASRQGIQDLKARMSDRFGGKTKTGNPNGSASASTKKPQKMREANGKRNDKWAKKENKKLKKLNKSEKKLGGKLRKAKDKVMQKLTQNKVMMVFNKLKAMLMKLLFLVGKYAAILILIIWLGIVVCGIVMMIIESLFGPKTYKDTVCYQLYEEVLSLEDAWRDDVENFDSLWAEREDKQYGISYDSFANYISSMHGLELNGSTLYINPFYDVSGLVSTSQNAEALTELSGFNGEKTYGYSSNVNIYGKKNTASANGSYVSTESGHTSNLKDILALTDVIYQFEIAGSDDDSLELDMGTTPEKMNWEEFKGKWCTFWNNVGTWFGNLFRSEEDDKDYAVWEGLSYKSVVKYVSELFTASHRQQYDYSVSYHDVGTVELNVNGTMQEFTSIPESDASALGVCVSPITKSYKLMINTNDKVVPYLQDAYGTKYDLSTGRFEVNLSLTNGTYIDTDQCLWTGMASDLNTLNNIKNHMSSYGSGSCWSMTPAPITLPDSGYRGASSNWYDSQNDALNEAKNNLATNWNNFVLNRTESYTWTKDSSFIHKYYQKHNYSDSEIRTTWQTREVEEWKPYYWKNPVSDQNGDGTINYKDYYGDLNDGTSYAGNGECQEYFLVGSNAQLHYVANANYGDSDFTYDSNGDGYRDWHYEDFDGNGYATDVVYDYYYTTECGKKNALDDMDNRNLAVSLTYWASNAGTLDVWAIVEENGHWDNISCGYGYWTSVTWGHIVTKTQYKAIVNAPFEEYHQDVYTRACKGHDFSYCGGHLNVHAQGITNSISNELCNIGGTYNDEGQIPTVLDYDMVAAGYLPLIGKHIPNEANDENAQNYATSGGCQPASLHIQGSDVATRGFNLYTEATGQWKSGTNLRTDIESYQYRDIFDSDSAVDKGHNIFPLSKEGGYVNYDGWCADNMTLAAMKATSDWKDIYEFDIPLEIDGQVLTLDEQELIVEGLKAHYGTALTEEREAAVRLALGWVGRGHYNENHTDHSFLANICNSVTYDANCTASDDKGFVRFVLYRSGKLVSPMSVIPKGQKLNTIGTSNLKPADILLHEGGGDYTQMQLNGLWISDEAVRAYNEETYVIYLGQVDTDIVIGEGTDYELTIKAGETLTIDLNNYDNSGTIRLRTQNASSWTDLDKDHTYYWVNNPDDKTWAYRFN